MIRPRSIVTAAAAAVTAFACAAPAAQAADSCPNAAYRTGAGANLPDCRAWEQLTTVEKRGQEPTANFGGATNSAGDRAAFFTGGDIGGADSVSLSSTYVATRNSAWTSLGVDPPLDTADVFLAQGTMGLSPDLSKGLVVSQRKLTPGAVEGATNLYLRDTADRSYRLAASVPGGALYRDLAGSNGSQNGVRGSDSGFTHILFGSSLALTPDALGGGSDAYELGPSGISIANRDVGGDVIPGGPALVPSGQNAVSQDGRRTLFIGREGGTQALFQRIDGSRTALISHSDRTGDTPSDPVGVNPTLVGASADGTSVTFATSDSAASLTDDGPSPLYRWSADDGRVTSLLNGTTPSWSPGATTFQLVSVSPDGRYLWFTLQDANANGENETQLHVLDTVQRKATRAATFETGLGPSGVRASADGSRIAVLTPTALTGYEQNRPGTPCPLVGTGPAGPPAPCAEVFSFDAADPATPTCVSCGSPGTQSAGNAGLGEQQIPGPNAPRAITDDGRVYFDTAQPLAPSDANSQQDVYEYAPGRGASLLSGGVGGSASTLLSVSASGRDAFFFTRDPLVAQDFDTLIDVYDARVDGGIAAQQVSRPSENPCATRACGNAPSAPPGGERSGTSAFRPAPVVPGFSVSKVSADARRAAVASGRLKVAVSVGAAGRLSARATARLGRRSTTIGRATATARRSGRSTLTLPLTKEARRALARGRTLRVSLSVSYSRASKASTQTFQLVERTRKPRTSRGGAR